MITNFKQLSEALDTAAPAPGAGLVAAIRADEDRINREIKQTGVSYVTIDGRKFKLLSAATDGGTARR